MNEEQMFKKLDEDQFVADVSSGMYFAIRDLEPVELK